MVRNQTILIYTGEEVMAMVTVDISITVTELNLINTEDTVLQSISNLSNLGRGTYAGTFMPPSQTFTLQLVGVDNNGFNFSHISDTSTEVSFINLSLGTLTNSRMLAYRGEL